MNIATFKVSFFIILSFVSWSYTTQRDSIQVLDASGLQINPEENQLKILSWNIKMLPAPYGWLFKPYKRAESIIQSLEDSDTYDIIFFQEAFSGSVRSKIYKTLKNIYPYQIEPKYQKVFYKSNSGLWAISRLPITLIDDISFTKIRAWDRLASKGAKLYSIRKNQKEFYLINTHFQSDYKTDYSDIRSSQYTEIYKDLILPNEKSDVPLILCGDLNISQSAKLKTMLEKLKLKNGPMTGKLQHSTLGRSKELLDYILVKSEHAKFHSVKRRIIDFSRRVKGEKFLLSDHYPIEAVISWD